MFAKKIRHLTTHNKAGIQVGLWRPLAYDF